MIFKFKINFILLIFLTFTCKDVFSQQTITLETALEIASQNSPDIRQAKLNLERSSQLLNAKNAALKSQFSLQLTPFTFIEGKEFEPLVSDYNPIKTKLSSALFTISQPIKWTDGTLQLINRFRWQETDSKYKLLADKGKSRSYYYNNLYLEFNQPIFTYNRTKLELKELELDLENTTLDYTLQKLALEKSISQEFYDVYLKKMSLEIVIQELNNREQSYQIIKNKVDAGIAPMEDFYQAELDLATSQSTVENAQVSLENALDNFKMHIGISIFEEISVVTDISHNEVEIDMEKALDYGTKHRLELRQREINIEYSLFNLIQTSAINEFKGNIRLSYGLIGTDENLPDIYNERTESQEVSLTLEIPLWDWGEKKSRIKASQANVDSRTFLKQDEENNIIIGIRQAYRQVKNQTTQIKIAKQNVKNAELTYEINLERYKNGDLTSMDLNLFENQLSEKKIGHIEALINYKLALLNLKIQSLWDFEKERPVLPE